jgi:hypothetical protein
MTLSLCVDPKRRRVVVMRQSACAQRRSAIESWSFVQLCGRVELQQQHTNWCTDGDGDDGDDEVEHRRMVNASRLQLLGGHATTIISVSVVQRRSLGAGRGMGHGR